MTPAEPDPGTATARGAAMDALAAGGRAILGRSLESRELELFSRYLDLLRKWQRIHRLVGSVEPGWVVEHLFLDSLLFLRALPPTIRSIADIGSGAGFPGIPIKIVRPAPEMVLIEARQRRVSFLSTVVRELDLTGALVLNRRVEELSGGVAGPFDAIVMRCAGGSTALLAAAERLVAPGGVVIISGPPPGQSTVGGELVEVPGVIEGRTRRFVIHRASTGAPSQGQGHV